MSKQVGWSTSGNALLIRSRLLKRLLGCASLLYRHVVLALAFAFASQAFCTNSSSAATATATATATSGSTLSEPAQAQTKLQMRYCVINRLIPTVHESPSISPILLPWPPVSASLSAVLSWKMDIKNPILWPVDDQRATRTTSCDDQ